MIIASWKIQDILILANFHAIKSQNALIIGFTTSKMYEDNMFQ